MSYDDNPQYAYYPHYPSGAGYYYDPQYYNQSYAQQQLVHYNEPAGNVPIAQENTGVASWFNFKDSSFLKGFAVGAGIALIVSNPTVQNALISGAVKCWSAVQGGVEEVKEKVQDVKAEMSQDS